jgi:peroxiredoxin
MAVHFEVWNGTTFVIGPDGVITHVFRKVKPAEHDDRVLAALAA